MVLNLADDLLIVLGSESQWAFTVIAVSELILLGLYCDVYRS
jgi:hypothetical protein